MHQNSLDEHGKLWTTQVEVVGRSALGGRMQKYTIDELELIFICQVSTWIYRNLEKPAGEYVGQSAG